MLIRQIATSSWAWIFLMAQNSAKFGSTRGGPCRYTQLIHRPRNHYFGKSLDGWEHSFEALLSIGLAVIVVISGPAQAQKKLKFNFFPPVAETNYGSVLVPYLEKVAEASQGTISVDSFPGGSLGKNPRLQLKMMADGVFDITWAVAAYTPGRFPDNGVMELPGLFKTSQEASVTLWRLYDKGLLRGFDKIKVLGFGGLPPI